MRGAVFKRPSAAASAATVAARESVVGGLVGWRAPALQQPPRQDGRRTSAGRHSLLSLSSTIPPAKQGYGNCNSLLRTGAPRNAVFPNFFFCLAYLARGGRDGGWRTGAAFTTCLLPSCAGTGRRACAVSLCALLFGAAAWRFSVSDRGADARLLSGPCCWNGLAALAGTRLRLLPLRVPRTFTSRRQRQMFSPTRIFCHALLLAAFCF